MHGLQEIIRLNAPQQRTVDGHVAASGLSQKIRANKDRRAEKARKAGK